MQSQMDLMELKELSESRELRELIVERLDVFVEREVA